MQDFSRATKTFLYTCYAAGIILTVFNLASLSFKDPLMLVALCTCLVDIFVLRDWPHRSFSLRD